MKKLLLIISLLLPMIFSVNPINVCADDSFDTTSDCGIKEGIVRIVDVENNFKGNGFIYKIDSNYIYIVSSSKNSFDGEIYALYENGLYGKLDILGNDTVNEIIVFKTDKIEGVKNICIGNGLLLDKGEKIILSGYTSVSEKNEITSFISSVGVLFSKKDYVRVYKDSIGITYDSVYDGSAIFNVSGYLVGMFNGSSEKMIGKSYSINSNKLIKSADSIIKYGKYESNYIKYTLEDYSSLSVDLKESYDVSDSASYGVVITTFKVFNFLFGKLNQGMVIVEVNGVKIENTYDLDVELTRYNKKDKICFKVIKTNGKEAYYYQKI